MRHAGEVLWLKGNPGFRIVEYGNAFRPSFLIVWIVHFKLKAVRHFGIVVMPLAFTETNHSYSR